MENTAFDALVRRSSDALTRRGSLAALGGLVAAITQADVSKAKKEGRGKKQSGKRCRRQVAPCQAYFAGMCNGDPECMAHFQPCCDKLATCDSAGLLQCIFSCSCPGLPEFLQDKLG